MAERQKLVRQGISALVEDFLVQRLPDGAEDWARLASIDAYDRDFLVFWRMAHDRHLGRCAACQAQQSCALGDALRETRPDPVTGVSERLHRHLLRIGQFEADGSGFTDLPGDEALSGSEAEPLSPAFARAAAALMAQATRYGERFRMMGDGTIVDRETYDAVTNHWMSRLPDHPPRG